MCTHEYSDGTEAINIVKCKLKDKYGKEHIVNDYAYCEICGKRFCVSD